MSSIDCNGKMAVTSHLSSKEAVFSWVRLFHFSEETYRETLILFCIGLWECVLCIALQLVKIVMSGMLLRKLLLLKDCFSVESFSLV